MEKTVNTLAQGWAAINRQPQSLTARSYAWACRNADAVTITVAVATMAACAVGVTLINMGVM